MTGTHLPTSGGRALPRSVRLWHRLASHGLGPTEAVRLRTLWEDHCLEMQADGIGNGQIRFEAVRSAVVHIWARLLHGTRTTIPCGLALLLAAIGTGLFALDPTTSETFAVKIHLTIGLVLLAAVFVVQAGGMDHWPLAIATGALGTGLVHLALVVGITRWSDYLVVVGALIGGGALLATAGQCLSHKRPVGLRALGLGSGIIGLADIEWAFAVDETGTALSHLITGFGAVLAGVYIWKTPLRLNENAGATNTPAPTLRRRSHTRA